MSAGDPLAPVLLCVSVGAGCWIAARAVRRVGQPAVVGEIAAGILLGPSLLGRLWPTGQALLFPPDALPVIEALGDLGLLVFMFLVGHRFDLPALRGHSRIALAVGQGSVLLPLLAGGVLALAMYPSLAPPGVARLPFVLFIAVSLSVTAFPVLARILADRGLHHTTLGTLATACAAVDDITAWCLLALAVALTRATSLWQVPVTIAEAFGFVAAMTLGVRPLLACWASRVRNGLGAPSDSLALVLLFTGLSLSALITDAIGIHAIFGAFLFGVVTPRALPCVDLAARHLESVAMPVLLPLFFITVGLGTNIGLLGAHARAWLWFVAILVVAVAGKWGGTAAAARLCGGPWRESLALGSLMNCRGVTELVVLNVGLSLGVLGSGLFTMLVLMALATTAMTVPALNRLQPSATTTESAVTAAAQHGARSASLSPSRRSGEQPVQGGQFDGNPNQ
ncbi:cation:proton antiporter [Streptomyces sp. NPDC008092]|uniref:cation:proton antiporter domain-containing protein n=1 Tax=Streptomyces sp. NPDC008092 TaxID=3364808 RepID=UPI0036E5D2FE